MNAYTSIVENVLYFALDSVTYLMSLLQTNISGHYQMKVYIALASSPTCP